MLCESQYDCGVVVMSNNHQNNSYVHPAIQVPHLASANGEWKFMGSPPSLINPFSYALCPLLPDAK